ncbi:hypothetical protein [Emticicia aquatilis]|nr:hypothetical protein [Emticicia aquatilis]
MEEIKFTNGLIIQIPDSANMREQFGVFDDALTRIVRDARSAASKVVIQVLKQLLKREPNHNDVLLCDFVTISTNESIFFYDGVRLGIIAKEPNPLSYTHDTVFTPDPAFA